MPITVNHMPNLSTYSQAIIEAAKRQEEEQRSLAGAQLSLGAISARRPAPTYGGGGGGGGSTGGTSAYQQRMIDEANSLAFQQRAAQSISSLYPQQPQTQPQTQQQTASSQPVEIINRTVSQPSSGGFNWSGLGSSLYDFFLNPK